MKKETNEQQEEKPVTNKEWTHDELWDIFISFGQPAIIMNQYELSDLAPEISSKRWREFLQQNDVQKYIEDEMEIISSQGINKMLTEAPNARSVGMPQTITAMQKIKDANSALEPETFIFSYVPPDTEQMFSPNFRNALESESLSVEQQMVREEIVEKHQLLRKVEELERINQELTETIKEYERKEKEWTISQHLGNIK